MYILFSSHALRNPLVISKGTSYLRKGGGAAMVFWNGVQPGSADGLGQQPVCFIPAGNSTP